MSDFTITLNWIRHGESCANLGQKNHKDIVDKQKLADLDDLDDLDVKQENDSWDDFDFDFDDLGVKDDKIHDVIVQVPAPDQKIGFWSSLSIPNVIKSSTSKIASIPDVINSSSSQMASAFLYEPNLSFIGMNHAINLGTEYFTANNNTRDIYISSPLTRTITTALLSLRFIENAVIYVVPYINEKNNCSDMINLDYQNTAVDSVLLKKKILFIKEWLEHFWIIKFDDIEIRKFIKDIWSKTSNELLKIRIYNLIKERKNKESLEDRNTIQILINYLLENQNLLGNINVQSQNTLTRLLFYKGQMNRFKRGPQVNFEIYEYYEKLYISSKWSNKIPEPTKCNPEFFHSDILPYILSRIRYSESDKAMRLEDEYQPLSNDIRIYAFAHGSLIRKIWEDNNRDTYDTNKYLLDLMMNTAIITDEISFNEGQKFSHKFSINSYQPEKIRENYMTNIETYNRDICDIGSIKGVINYMNDDTKLIQYKGKPEVDFYFKNKSKIESEGSLLSQFGGNVPSQFEKNKHKSILYKNKYFQLKNNFI